MADYKELNAVKKSVIVDALLANDYNVRKTAAYLGIRSATVYNWLRKAGMPKRDSTFREQVKDTVDRMKEELALEIVYKERRV